MISHLCGKVFDKGDGFAVIDLNGLGIRVFMPQSDIAKLPPQGEAARVFTYLSVKEDALDLFGFIENEGLKTFERLISINGVGPKAALSILSTLTPREVALAVVANDVKAFTRANGIGSKIAQRIILELKDKIGESDVLPNSAGVGAQSFSMNSDSAAVNALIALGCSPSAAQKAVMQVGGDGKTTEEIIKAALALLKS